MEFTPLNLDETLAAARARLHQVIDAVTFDELAVLLVPTQTRVSLDPNMLDFLDFLTEQQKLKMMEDDTYVTEMMANVEVQSGDGWVIYREGALLHNYYYDPAKHKLSDRIAILIAEKALNKLGLVAYG